MMGKSMYTRMLAVFILVIVLSMGLIGSLIIMYVRNDRIDARMHELKTQAREIAWLASQVEFGRISTSMTLDGGLERYMQWKAESIYDEFRAYILVVDRNGRMKHNLYTTLEGGEDVTESLNENDLQSFLAAILSGHELEMRSTSSEGPVFTVGVPWVENDDVWGAVFIHTAAQNIHAVYQEIVWQVAVATFAATLAAMIAAFFFTRQITRPLTQMVKATQDMAKGHFSPIETTNSTREVIMLTRAFNDMGVQLAYLEQSRRDFVANVSHELRSPVTNIQGYIQGMTDGTIPMDSWDSSMRIVADETHRLSRLIVNLLNLSRMEHNNELPQIKTFNINELARRVIVRRVNQFEEKKLDMDVAFQYDPCPVRADEDMIEQVITNLMDNAAKFTPVGGKIWLSTRRDGGTVYLKVRDNGIGVLPEDAPHIFDRFFKGDKAHTSKNGTGLGLAICRRIMELHNQSIQLLQNDGGAAFEITLEAGASLEAPHAEA